MKKDEKGDNKNAILEAEKAFESTMKSFVINRDMYMIKTRIRHRN